jgi:hypothetical protein
MSDKVSFRYDTKKIAALKELAYLERKRTSQIIREALDARLGFEDRAATSPGRDHTSGQ